MSALQQQADHLMKTVSGQRYEIILNPLPESLLQRTCSEPLIAELLTRNKAGTQRVQIRCQGKQSWSLYIKGKIDLYVDVLVSRHPMNKGDRLQTSDVTFREENISQLRRGYLNRYEQLSHQQLANRIKAGTILTPSMLIPEQIIRRGDRITITARGQNSAKGGFTISMPGEALGNGALHQQIRVKNLSSGKIVKGKIISPSEVIVQ